MLFWTYGSNRSAPLAMPLIPLWYNHRELNFCDHKLFLLRRNVFTGVIVLQQSKRNIFCTVKGPYPNFDPTATCLFSTNSKACKISTFHV